MMRLSAERPPDVRVAFRDLGDQLALVRGMPDRHAPRRQRREQRQFQPLGDLRGQQPELGVELIDDEPNPVGRGTCLA